MAVSLTKQVARDGEGAEKLIEVHVDGGQSPEQAKRVAKAIVNSPLVKTAVHGADPNWGRVAMAIGKSTTADEVDQVEGDDPLRRSRGLPVAGRRCGSRCARRCTCAATRCASHADLAAGDASATVWGCDLTDGYVRINADYTT